MQLTPPGQAHLWVGRPPRLSRSGASPERLLVMISDLSVKFSCLRPAHTTIAPSFHSGINQRILNTSTTHLGAAISKGGTSDLYAWSEGRVLKLRHARFPRTKAEEEFQITRALHSAGLPVPAAYDLHESDGRFGFVLERIEGISLLQLVERQPWKLFYSARLLAELHTQLHQHTAPAGIPTQRQQLQNWLARAADFTADQRRAAESSLAQLPDGSTLCHGDFHPGNILLSARGPVIIDWSTATCGHPPADVARTSVLFESGSLPPDSPRYMHLLLKVARQLLHRTYLHRYLALRGGILPEITKFLPIQRAATSAWRCGLPD